tara:strand:+ start:38 stop:463 length:426 start_codon:yes stop_codon:yes gene_type:complete
MKKILLIHGPNLNLLGAREPEVYGKESQKELFKFIDNSFPQIDFIFFQSNHEGDIIDKIHAHINSINGIIINPGAFSHYSYAIRDAISAVNIPTIEVHLSNVHNRESFRKILVISDVCIDTIIGKGKYGYIDAVNQLGAIK